MRGTTRYLITSLVAATVAAGCVAPLGPPKSPPKKPTATTKPAAAPTTTTTTAAPGQTDFLAECDGPTWGVRNTTGAAVWVNWGEDLDFHELPAGAFLGTPYESTAALVAYDEIGDFFGAIVPAITC